MSDYFWIKAREPTKIYIEKMAIELGSTFGWEKTRPTITLKPKRGSNIKEMLQR